MTSITPAKIASIVAGTALLLVLCLAPATATAAGEFEPNDDSETAYGPLAAGVTYAATLESGEDFDYYHFYVAGRGASPVAITIANTTIDGDGLFVELLDSDEGPLDEINVPGQDFDVLEADLEPGLYYLALQTELFEQFDETYEIRAEGGAGAFASQAEVQAQCRRDTAALTKARAALAQARKRLRRVIKNRGSRKAKVAARRQIRTARARLKTANADAALLCPTRA